MPVEQSAELVERRREDGVVAGEPLAHAGSLRSLAGEEERRGALFGGRAGDHCGRKFARGERGQAGEQVLAGGADDGRAMREVGAGGGQRAGDGDLVGVLGDELAKRLRLGAEGGFVAGGHQPERGRTLLDGRNLRCRRTFRQHDVAVRATHTERAHPRDERPVRPRPRPGLPAHGEPEFLQRYQRVRPLEVQARRQPPVFDRQHGLDQTGDPGGPFQVPDVGLDRADLERPVAPATQCRPERGRFDRVAAPRPGAVELDVLHGKRIVARPRVRRPDDVALGVGVRHDERLAGAVVVDRAAGDHGVDQVPVGDRQRQRLEHDQPAALAAHVPVRPRVEGEALVIR
ncbi:hypothetical protein Lesp02_14090 [Lentzea sp. NBRC 105346]|nr:hypothetical protein Lesp02_14090 [Lentzea sp. NBRC 105346]